MDITKNSIRIFLHKPNYDSLGEITAFLKPSHQPKLGVLSKLSFTIPQYKNNREENKYFNLIREKYLLKVDWLNKSEWYIVDEINNSGSQSGNEKLVTSYLLPYEMRGQRIFDWAGALIEGEYRKESLTIDVVSTDITKNVGWNIDYIDPDLLGIWRDFDFEDNLTIVEALYEIAETFKAIIIWDTHNRTFSFYKEDNYQNDGRILISHDKYLKSIEDQIKPNEIVTRLLPIGKDGITINQYNPTSSPYLMDFSYFMQPFKAGIKKWSDLTDGTKWSDL